MPPPSPPLPYGFEDRFSGLIRLYGRQGVLKLTNAHIAVVGVGGVGSWAVEALCRSGVGALTLVDMDEVCVSNTNRQLHATQANYGKAKITALKERCLAINPNVIIREELIFWTEKTQDAFFERLASESIRLNYVFDAIDSFKHKIEIIRQCRGRDIPVISSGSGGGRRDPGQIQIKDMSLVRDDPLLKQVRKALRQKHGFPRTGIKDGNRKGTKKPPSFHVPCVVCPGTVYEPGEMALPACDITPTEDASGVSVASEISGFSGDSGGSQVSGFSGFSGGGRMSCDQGYGAATFVTGIMGMMAAGYMVNGIVKT